MSSIPTLNIRGQNSDDWESLYVLWKNNSEIVLNSFELPYISEDAFREFTSSPQSSSHALIAETSLPSGRKRIVGAAWLRIFPNPRRRHVARLTLLIDPDYYGTDIEAGILNAALELADDWLSLRRVEVIAFVDDVRAVDLYQQHEFTIEATMRQYAFRQGLYSDAYLLARRHMPAQRAIPSEEDKPA